MTGKNFHTEPDHRVDVLIMTINGSSDPYENVTLQWSDKFLVLLIDDERHVVYNMTIVVAYEVHPANTLRPRLEEMAETNQARNRIVR